MSITWNGVSSDTIGVIVERIPNRYVPTRRFSPQQVAGRNGNILLVDKSFPNVEQEYEVYLSAEAQGLPSVAMACAEWLMGPTGYCRLQDSYDTTVYREAFLMGGYDLENILNKFGRCTITFSCKPQKYLLAGDTPISIPAGATTTYTGSSVQFDGITGASITSLSTTITPTQDLHGYANPWPAGGGVNLVDPSKKVTASATTGRWYNDGTGFLLHSGQTYTLSANVGTDVTYFVYIYAIGGTQLSYGKWTATYTPSADVYVYFQYYESGGAHLADAELQLELGSTATSFATYENICPITGITGLSVYVSPTQDPDDATVYAVDWSAQAGTVYGGTLDVVTGVLTVNRYTKSFTGTESYTNYTSVITCNETFPVGLSVAGSDILCSHSTNQYVHFSNSSKSRVQFDKAVFGVTSVDELKAKLAAWDAGGEPLQYSYELATPLTYQLTPQVIGVLTGTNYVWLSDGDVSLTVTTPLGGIVTNPTPFEARPLLEVSGVGEITINGKSIQILESVSDFQIDCEAMEAEDNSKIYCVEFPELSGGENVIVGDGSITAMTVTPRWWTL